MPALNTVGTAVACLVFVLACGERGKSLEPVSSVDRVIQNAAVDGPHIGAVVTTPAGELGVVRSARMSPNGRWVAITDATPPYVKLADSNRIIDFPDIFAALQWEAPPYGAIVAISNTRLLVFRGAGRSASLVSFDGQERVPIDGIDFVPWAATAITDSTWFIYGPSLHRRQGGRSWAHCLYVNAEGRTSWISGLDVSGDLAPYTRDPPLVTVSGATAWIQDAVRPRHLFGVMCGPPSSPAVIVTDTIVASESRRLALSVITGSSTNRETRYALINPGTDRLLLRVEGQRRPPPSRRLWLAIRAIWSRKTEGPVSSSMSLVQIDGSPRGSEFRISRYLVLLDSRSGVGTIFITPDPYPMLFAVADSTLLMALR